MEQLKTFAITGLTLEQFKGYGAAHKFSFGAMNVISGHTGTGKSSIADAIAFAVTGVPFHGEGKKLDNLYHHKNPDAGVSITMEFIDDHGRPRCLIRQRQRDNMEIMLDGVAIRQHHLNELFGDKDLFLSIFNPHYFVSLGENGRKLLEQYLPRLDNPMVFSQLDQTEAALLEAEENFNPESCAQALRESMAANQQRITALSGQHELLTQRRAACKEALDKDHQGLAVFEEIKTRLEAKSAAFDSEKAYMAWQQAEAAYLALKQQKPAAADTTELDLQIKGKDQSLGLYISAIYQSSQQEQLATLNAEVGNLKEQWHMQNSRLTALAVGQTCPQCLRQVTAQNIESIRRQYQCVLDGIVKEGQEKAACLTKMQQEDAQRKAEFERDREERIAGLKASARELTAERDKLVQAAGESIRKLQEQLETAQQDCLLKKQEMEYQGLTSAETVELGTAHGAIGIFEGSLRADAQDDKTMQSIELEAAELQAENSTMREKLSAIVHFITKRMEMQLTHLRMNRVAILLYDLVKTTGELKPAFRITYNDLPYSCLSTSERVKAGLEISELMQRLSGCAYPVFIDSCESVLTIDNVRPSGQLFMSYVRQDAELNVEDVSAPAVEQAA